MSKLVWKAKTFDELSTKELYQILKARNEVFVVEQNCPYLDTDGTDEKALHLWAENEGEVWAYCRLFPQGIKYPEASIGRVLTTEKSRGSGVGKQMMVYAVSCIENVFHTSEIRISAQDYLLEFYGSFGFVDTGKKYLEDDIPHTEMLRS